MCILGIRDQSAILMIMSHSPTRFLVAATDLVYSSISSDFPFETNPTPCQACGWMNVDSERLGIRRRLSTVYQSTHHSKGFTTCMDSDRSVTTVQSYQLTFSLSGKSHMAGCCWSRREGMWILLILWWKGSVLISYLIFHQVYAV